MDLNTSLAISKALADRSRLLILNALTGGPLCTEQIATMLGLAASTTSFHLNKLVKAGLLTVRREQYYSFYSLTPAAGLSLADLVHFDNPALDTETRRLAEEEARVVRAFFSDGRLVRMPAQKRKQQIVLEEFASMFQPGSTFEEREVDRKIEAVFGDYCLVRRLLVDERYMERDHGVYRRTDKPARGRMISAPSKGQVDVALSSDARKRLKEEYKNRKRTAGVFSITNTGNGRVFLGSCLDAERPMRRIFFELELGSFINRALQEDFKEFGKDAFVSELLETVKVSAEDPDHELEKLEEKYLAKLDWANTYNRDRKIRFR